MCEACRLLPDPPSQAPKASADSRPGTQVEVHAYHNVATNFGRSIGLEGYVPGQPVVLVFATREPAADALALCETVFELLNIGDDPQYVTTPDPRAVKYRARRNRSLCVGHIVSQTSGNTTEYFAVASAGFARIDPPCIVRKAVPGTTPLDEPDPT
jgi:hypothetical protein